jgi:FkbM family methyltransferase
VKVLAVLLLDRWNAYTPLKWRPVLQAPITYQERPIRLAVRMDSNDSYVFRELFLYHHYDHPLGEPATILDLGANCGYATLLFAARYPNARIAAVEPHADNLAALRSNLELNGVQAVVFEGAATREDGAVTLFVRESLSHGLVVRERTGHGGELTVRGFSIPTLLNQLEWDHIDLLKIDIEGYERVLFAGHPPWLRRVTRIIGEYHDSYRLSEVSSDLCPLGFAVTALPGRNMFLAVRNGQPGREAG